MSRYSEPMWESDVKDQIKRLALVFTSLKSGAIEVYLDTLEFCSASGVKQAVDRWLQSSDPQGRTPTPGQILAHVPSGQIDHDGMASPALSGWSIEGNLFGPWADKQPVCGEREAQQIADYVAAFWNFVYTPKLLELFRKLGVEPPEAPVKQERMDLSA